jgi:hypothetical protein
VSMFLKMTEEAKFVQRKSEALLCKYFYSEKAVSTIHFECVFVAYSIRHEMHMRFIVIYDLSNSTIFMHLIS